ncbi:hypothetical protein CANINC_000634 [Pichia inconspicua]|uniref:Pyridoxamine 5'-phosphate oxidase N-terminal domain-containing protein n=1 Tax=Pichia inconspicua TaxID=52247 RepID=A0A4T0X5I0_9ASCO|nr:hypothetical protein CANINC_000634 [[Candida] inconspicua]
MSGPLPDNVHSLLSKSKFLHLATCADNTPHVSLMNYTLINSGPYENQILFCTPKNTKKYQNLVANPKVSILIHDWTSSVEDQSLRSMIENLNKNEIGDLSITMDGHVTKTIGEEDKDFEEFKALHLAVNPRAGAFVNGDTAFVLVKIDVSKVSDSRNNVEEYK